MDETNARIKGDSINNILYSISNQNWGSNFSNNNFNLILVRFPFAPIF